MNDEESGKPKIVIDDDWKARAQAEKEWLQQQAAAKQKQTAPAAEPDEPSPPRDEKPEADMPLPPASFSFLVTSLATQALATMGQIPGEDGKPVIQLAHSKHFIDTLDILETKTKGNLTSDEAAMLTNVLHQLRLMFVAVGKQQPNDSGS